MKRLTQNLFLTAFFFSLFLHLGAATVVYFKKAMTKQPDRSVEMVLVDKAPVQVDRALSKEKIELRNRLLIKAKNA